MPNSAISPAVAQFHVFLRLRHTRGGGVERSPREAAPPPHPIPGEAASKGGLFSTLSCCNLLAVISELRVSCWPSVKTLFSQLRVGGNNIRPKVSEEATDERKTEQLLLKLHYAASLLPRPLLPAIALERGARRDWGRGGDGKSEFTEGAKAGIEKRR